MISADVLAARGVSDESSMASDSTTALQRGPDQMQESTGADSEQGGSIATAPSTHSARIDDSMILSESFAIRGGYAECVL
ncbi:uncharacterized protein K489DRAFT_383398, partial [Dissoconium aciculare CBS 342.82]|uniref:Uncharacterized protein n=1 Tax=Dissoconium aciculare CBS 342.82 TaxID=1314786 RepID=A0A6J3LYX4_9PEZI